MIETINLTKKQHQAIQNIMDWYASDDKFFVLAGYAGTGKSTLANRLQEKIGGTFCSYTAKAADVLNKKGVNACTIHSLIYNYEGRDEKTKKLLWSLKSGQSKLLIVDEYSMIDSALMNDLKQKADKILFLGDPAQLPPIKDGKQILEPDYFLDEIHRQAKDNPIVKWAHEIRQGNIPYQNMNDNDQFIVKSTDELTEEEMKSADQIIVGKNKTRRHINNTMREIYAFSDVSNLPVRGEKLIQKKNNHKEGLVNGNVFTCERNAKDWSRDSERYGLYIDGKEYDIWDGDVLGKDPNKYNFYSGLERVDYAYAITCHSAQGSEYDSVVIINEGWGEQKLNWLYTAVTRAKKKVILAHPS